VFFAGISLVHFRKFGYTGPVQTALLFIAFVIAMDFFPVGLLVNRGLEMFASLLGTWFPFALIFVATWLTGLFIVRTGRGYEIVFRPACSRQGSGPMA
jgi:hypothetical protein